MNKAFTFFRESQVARFFIPLGIILIIFGGVLFFINTKNQNFVKTTAIVTKMDLVEEEHKDNDGNTVDATYKIYVKYTVDGSEYETELGELSNYKVGQKTTIYYDPNDPSNITQSKNLILPLVIMGGGVASLVGGVISGKNAIKRYRKMKEQEKEWANE